MLATACSSLTGDTPTDSVAPTADVRETTTSSPSRDCLRVTGGTGPVDTGAPATDALFLAGQLFLCADDVVVVDPADLNEVAVGAQLAAAVGGPLLFTHPQVAAEVGRLKPQRVHLIGSVEVLAPVDSEVLTHQVSDAVAYAREALGVTGEVLLPAVADASTVVETVNAIRDRDRVVVPQTASTPTTDTKTPPIDISETVRGLAVPSDMDSIWMADASDPVTLLLAAGTGRSVVAGVVAINSKDILGYPEVGEAIAGYEADEIRLVGGVPEADEWELRVLANGQQVPGGGFYILPKGHQRRYVAFYGHPETSGLGVLGEQDGEQTIERMQPFLDAYEGDGSQTIPTFEIIATVAAASAGDDGNYSYEWPSETFDDLIETAENHDAYVVLDLQPGRSDFLTQAQKYEDLLKLPNVGLALDPEWRLGPNQVHLVQVGHVNSAEINEVIAWLGDLVRDNGLPQKMLLLHMFRPFMIQDREILVDRPELQIVIQMDGDGTEPQKDATWDNLQQGFEDAFWSWGWKNFFDEDEPGPPTPESTMSKDPTPVYVSYQ
ncbi:MAG: hypothetical protein U9N56_05995 [Actinomycetota bacterium]|nr:hypothetical protein [Actinomycetota bacterium]